MPKLNTVDRLGEDMGESGKPTNLRQKIGIRLKEKCCMCVGDRSVLQRLEKRLPPVFPAIESRDRRRLERAGLNCRPSATTILPSTNIERSFELFK